MGYIEDRIIRNTSRSPMCPPEFHEMAAMVELGAFLGHRVYMEWDTGPVYMTPRCVVVAESSRAKKSTGLLYPTQDIINGVQAQLTNSSTTILETTSTPEGFFDSLCTACPLKSPRRTAVRFQDEWSRFFSEAGKQYMAGGIEAYIVACEGKPESRKLSKDLKSHGEVSLVVLHAMVRENYDKVADSNHFTSGLFPRHFVRIGRVRKYKPRALKNLNPLTSIDFVTKLKDLAAYYDQTGTETVCSWAPDAQKAWNRWCIRNDKLGENEDGAIQVIRSRAEDLFQIMAMAYAVSDNVYTMKAPATIVMDLAHFKKISKRVQPYIDDCIELYGGCGQRHIKAVRKILQRLGGKQVPLWKVSKQFTAGDSGDGEDFNRALASLETQDEIIKEPTTNPSGRPGEIITLITDISEKVKK